MQPDITQDLDVVRNIAAIPAILEIVCNTTGMGFAAVARVTREQWVACDVLDRISFGLKPGDELELATTICNEIRDHRTVVVIDNVAEDPDYCSHPTPALYGFQSYISVPVTLADGSFFGTLCAIDPRPTNLKSGNAVGTFKLFSELIAMHVDAGFKLLKAEHDLEDERVRRATTESNLLDANATAELREQFIAVLGHDLRNPLAGFSSGINLLRRQPQDERSDRILRMMAASAARMGGLIDNLLDFARGRLGGGIALARERKLLEPTLTDVLDELRLTWPDRTIEAELALDHPVDGDHARLAQLFSNLLGNAITHGAEDKPIRVRAVQGSDGLHLSVSNGGHPIPAEVLDHLFKPFHRGPKHASMQGLGLGLFIASEIARAHGGSLDVSSDERETSFTLKLPSDLAIEAADRPERTEQK
jgi:signal transduction histidine kinase